MADVKEIVNRIWDSALGDVTYGANRTINGLTGGALDYLGSKYNIDTQMNGYLSQKSQEERMFTSGLGDLAQVGGGLLWGSLLPFGSLRKPYNVWQISRAYDKLSKNPYIGSGKDVIAKMKNHKGETVLLQRGEAIPGEGGKVITHGNKLNALTGTRRNFGLNKAIYKHGVTKEQAKKIPDNISTKPAEVSERGQDIYETYMGQDRLRTVSSPVGKQKTISSYYVIDR